MKYMGSKSRHWRDITRITLAGRTDEQCYVEPFAGGFNVICNVDGWRIASDSNRYVVAMFRAVQSGWEPPDSVGEELYNSVRADFDAYDEALVGFIGVACSYSGKFFGGYARGEGRDYCGESKRNLLKQNLSGIDIRCSDYRELEIPPNSLIYCDPPYRGATKYRGGFDHDEFWQWCRDQHGHTVFISEYTAPDDFECVWEKQVCSSLTKDTGSKTNTERLFTRIRNG
jgi:DNA adenine methylase